MTDHVIVIGSQAVLESLPYETGVCVTHCCSIHGCKYSKQSCVVARGEFSAFYPNENGCETCEYLEEEDRENGGLRAALRKRGLLPSLTAEDLAEYEYQRGKRERGA